MSLVDDIFAKISDTKPIGAHLGNGAVKELYEAYQRCAKTDDTLSTLSEDMNGWDFKQALALLPSATQVSLFYTYLRATSPTFTDKEDPEEMRSKRRLRDFGIRFIIWVLGIGIIATISGAIVLAVKEGKAPSSELLESFLKTTTEVAEIIFSNGKS